MWAWYGGIVAFRRFGDVKRLVNCCRDGVGLKTIGGEVDEVSRKVFIVNKFMKYNRYVAVFTLPTNKALKREEIKL